MQFCGPFFLNYIIEYLDDEESDSKYSSQDAYLFAFAIALAYFFRAILVSQGWNYQNRAGYQSLTILQSSLYDKIFKLSQVSLGLIDQGKIITLSNNDALSVFVFLTQASLAPFIMIIIAITLIIYEVGIAGLIGVIILIIGSFLNTYIWKYLAILRKQSQVKQDQRGKIISQFLNGIKIVKLYGWEKLVIEKSNSIREEETKKIYSLQWKRTLAELIMTVFPILICVVIFQVYVALDNELTTSKALTTLGYLNILITPLRTLGNVLSQCSILFISLKRIQAFSKWEEKKKIVSSSVNLSLGELQIKNGYFSWQTEESKRCLEQFSNLTKVSNVKHNININQNQESNQALNMQNKFFENINLKIEAKSLTAIIGQVGSGKSSLAQALIGEMELLEGDVQFNGRIAYISQTPWLINETLKNNIVFGESYDEQKYRKVLKLAELEADIKILIDGDNTEIGERGINLSGGQKQRVCIARALYYNADIYIFDDALAALDSQVGNNIFKNVICNELKDKSRIVVTHSISFANKCEKIIVMKEAKIVEYDTYENLAKNPNSQYNILAVQNESDSSQQSREEVAEKEIKIELDEQDHISQQFNYNQLQPINMQKISSSSSNQLSKQNLESSNKIENEPIKSSDQLQKNNQKNPQKDIGHIEKQKHGAFSLQIYKAYFKFTGSCLSITLFILFGFQVGFSSVVEIWLGTWSTDKFDKPNYFYIAIFYGIVVVVAISLLSRGAVFCTIVKRFALKSSFQMIQSIMKSTMKFFDQVSSGKILNRTNKDQDDVDINLPWNLNMFISNIFSILTYFILIVIIQPAFLILILIFTPIYLYVGKIYLRAARELKRVNALARGPTLSLISEIYSGAPIIRTYKKEEYFFQVLEKRLDLFIKSASCDYLTSRWISIITDLIIAVLITFIVFFGVLAKDFNYVDDPSLIGVTILSILKITTVLSFSIKMYSSVELTIAAVERIMEYINKEDLEPSWDDPKIEGEWPSKGKIEMHNLSLQYEKSLPLVINNISLIIQPGEKIGVIGRTGSGKSTITLGLLRILEATPSKNSEIPETDQLGKIVIDGIDISQVGLHILRQNLSIIPQDPFVFTGTLRKNIDPFDAYYNSQIIDALKKAYIFDQIQDPSEEQLAQIEKQFQVNLSTLSNEEKKLYQLIGEGGQSFSLGQKQLLCMARAIVKNSKILIMDEATSSIDQLTDYNIQQMIADQFTNTTILTIAHRLNTIISYDKILVLDQGRISEFDTPWNLINKENSELKNLLLANGTQFFEQMSKIAQEKHQQKQNLLQ